MVLERTKKVDVGCFCETFFRKTKETFFTGDKSSSLSVKGKTCYFYAKVYMIEMKSGVAYIKTDNENFSNR